jgi:uncharacterized protein with PIN domain
VAVYFFDSSALVKRYAQETGTAWAQMIAARNYVFLARITQVELIAAIERRKRAGTLAASDAAAAIANFRAHLSTEYAMATGRSARSSGRNLGVLRSLAALTALLRHNLLPCQPPSQPPIKAAPEPTCG